MFSFKSMIYFEFDHFLKFLVGTDFYRDGKKKYL